MNIQFDSLPVIPLRITSKFGRRNTGLKGASTYHRGIDLGRNFSKVETEILSVADGTISNNYWNNTRGWVVIIDHGNFKTLYQHLKTKSPLRVGEKVQAGQPIGLMGASTKTIKGMAMHLHFELIVGGLQIDPEPYLRNIKPKKNEQEEEEVIKRYDKVSELPKGLQKEAQELVNCGALAGENGKLDVTVDMVRALIISKRYADKLRKESV